MNDLTIAEFCIKELEQSPVPTLEVEQVCFIHSRHSIESCRSLFKAVVNFHLNLELHRHPLDQNRRRQRRLLIYHDRKPPWAWSQRLLEVARLYARQLERVEHRAQLSTQGQAIRFEY